MTYKDGICDLSHELPNDLKVTNADLKISLYIRVHIQVIP